MPGYQRVPDFVRELITRCSTDSFYIGRTNSYSLAELADGKLSHLGIGVENATVTHANAVVPPIERGRWSKYNVDGRQVVRRDLPKFDKSIGGWESPNFGDWSKGSHFVNITRKVYRRETWYAKRLPILISAEAPMGGKVTLGFRVDRVFDRSEPIDERDLHMACSLLRENIGSDASVVSSELSVEQWLEDQRVAWEFLPKGVRGPQAFSAVVRRLGADRDSPRVRQMGDRFAVIDGLCPDAAIVVGTGEFSRYFGFKLREDLVALECLDYGNALYLMYEDWQELSQRSRVDLLADADANYTRIVHSSGWELSLRQALMLKGYQPQG